MNEIKDWLYVANTAIALAAAAYAWLTARSKANSAHLKAVDAMLDDHKQRIGAIEGEMRHMPAKDDVHELKIAIAELRGTIGRLDESHNGVSRIVNRIEAYLLDQGKGRAAR
jgi:hypothetical protein